MRIPFFFLVGRSARTLNYLLTFSQDFFYFQRSYNFYIYYNRIIGVLIIIFVLQAYV